MSNLDKNKYVLSSSEGSGDRVTEVQVRRVDNEPISPTEVGKLVSEFERLFPQSTYRLRHETKPQEDDVTLHVYVNYQKDESLQRSKTLGKRVTVSKADVDKLLEDW